MDGSVDTAILADFNANLGSRYQMILARMRDYETQKDITQTTVANQQYYQYPPGIVNIEGVVITIGNVHYPMTVVNSQWQWNWLNALQVQPTAIPQFILPRQSDYGIYPIPQTNGYSITFSYHYRDRNLSVEDYPTGSVTVTNGSATVTGSGTTFIPAMAGRWFVVSDVTNTGQGYWYRIAAAPAAGTLTLEAPYNGASGATLSYRVAQTPEIPEEGHILLVDGPTADFYSGIRHDIETATWYNNKFYTGDGQNASRDYGLATITGGLIGLYNQYTDRNTERVIDRKKKVYPFLDQVWGLTLSNS
jgi:hypothetical protein